MLLHLVLISVLMSIFLDFVTAATCVLNPSGGDDRQQIIDAFNTCGNGGIIRFPKGKTFILRSPISSHDYHSLSNAKIVIRGTINYEYDHVGQDDIGSTIYWEIEGDNVEIRGSGTINGNGQGWWDKHTNGPKMMSLSINGGSLTGVTLLNGPFHVLVVRGSDFTVNRVTIHTISNDYNNAYPGETDGINVGGQRIIVQNTDIIGGDDCISFLAGADTVHVNNVRCGGPVHGISVGSLGDSTGSRDGTVKNILVENIEYYDGGLSGSWPQFIAPQFVARIKTFGNSKDTGTVSNITWQHITAPNGVSSSGKSPVFITQNYKPASGDNQQTPANSGIKIKDITFSDIHGGQVANTKYGTVTIVCSKIHHCDNIELDNIVFSNTQDQHCTNVAGLHSNCRA